MSAPMGAKFHNHSLPPHAKDTCRKCVRIFFFFFFYWILFPSNATHTQNFPLPMYNTDFISLNIKPVSEHGSEIANDTLSVVSLLPNTYQIKARKKKHVFVLFCVVLFYMFSTIQIQFTACTLVTLYYKFGMRQWTANVKCESGTSKLVTSMDILF